MSILNAVKCEKSRWKLRSMVLSALCLVLTSCGSIEDTQDSVEITSSSFSYGDSVDEWLDPEADQQPTNIPDGYELFGWDELIPPGLSGEDVYARYQERLAALEDGSPEANVLYEQMLAEAEEEGGVLNNDLDGKKLQLAGFVAPLSYEEDTVTEFLLVPYFGACIHVPPPPPNQTILVTLGEGSTMKIEDTWGAVWVTGTLNATSEDTDLATAGYTITEATSGVYQS